MERLLALALLLGTVLFVSPVQAQELSKETLFVYQLAEMEVKASVLDYLASEKAPEAVDKKVIPYLTKLVAMEKADQARLQRKVLCLKVKNSHPACTLPENEYYKGKLVKDPLSKNLYYEGYDKKPLQFFLITIVRERLIVLNIQNELTKRDTL